MLRNRLAVGALVLVLVPSVYAGPGDQDPDVPGRISDSVKKHQQALRINWDVIKAANPATKLAELLDMPIEWVVGHTGFATSDYIHEGTVEQRLRSEIGTRPKNALHVVMLTEKGLAPVLCDILTTKPFRTTDADSHGKLLVIADTETIRNYPALYTYVKNADVAVLTNTSAQLPTVFAGVMAKAAADGVETELSMKEGGPLAVAATAQALLNARFAEHRDRLRIRLDTNFMPRDPAAEEWQMGASQFLATWKELGPYFAGVETEVGYHELPAYEWRGVESETKFQVISPTGPEALKQVQKLRQGTLHPQALVGRWNSDRVRATAAFDGAYLDVYVQVEASVAEQAEQNGFQVQVLFPRTSVSKSFKFSDMERAAITDFGDVYHHVLDLSETEIASKSAFEVALTINNVPYSEKDHDRGYVRPARSVVEQFEIITENATQKKFKEVMAYQWKLALVRAMHTEYMRLQRKEKTPLVKPLATWEKPLNHFSSRADAMHWLLVIMTNLADELNAEHGTPGLCPTGFLPQF